MSPVEIAGIFILPFVIAVSAAVMYWQVSKEASALTAVEANTYVMPAEEFTAIIHKSAAARDEPADPAGHDPDELKAHSAVDNVSEYDEIEAGGSRYVALEPKLASLEPSFSTREAAIAAAREAAIRSGGRDVRIEWSGSRSLMPTVEAGKIVVLGAPLLKAGMGYEIFRHGVSEKMYKLRANPASFETHGEFASATKRAESESSGPRPAPTKS